MSNILITGHTGYIGSMLTKRLQLTNNVILFQGDVVNIDDWCINLSKDIDIIYHLAAVEHTNTDIDIIRDWRVNSQSMLQLHEACKLKNISPKIVFTSSTNVFGNIDSTTITEDTREEVAAIWSAHKLLGENYLRILNKLHNVKYTVLMLPNVYGPSTSIDLMDRMVVNRVIKNAITNNVVTLFDNKSCLRDYLYIDDVIDAFQLLLDIDDIYYNGSRFLLGSNKRRTIEDVWQEIVNQIPGTSVNYNTIELASVEYRDYISSTDKFNSATKWSPKVKLSDGIAKTIEVYND
tara:strand:+ start:1098 stop:1973 length:876 start_codon:yes stop_codon:yes gene_type:complete